uniref:NADH-ubiquinone oxidoreductase chain 6 n=1 Tax=Onthophagus diabolicus TaxID=1848763 RepID=A0A1X9HET0_9SCAR|nr:NADH deshydrogenase subunit 6 [Onthophagus diabolicus]
MMLMIMLTSSMFLIWLKHPLSLGLILLIQTINMALYLGFYHLNYWFSYILFLIMIGGMLILFIYMTSVASNEKFYPSIKLFILFLIMMMMSFMLWNFMDPFYFNLNNIFNEFQTKKNNLSLNKYLNYPSHLMMYLLIIYLLISLLAIVKITNFKKNGTLRSSK